MASPAEIVSEKFALAQTYATNAQTALTGFTNALNAAVYAAPTVSVTWNSLTAPTLPAIPTAPTMPTIAFSAPSAPSAWVPDEPAITIDDFTEVAPTINLPTIHTPVYGATPTVPTPDTIAVPDAPTLATVAVPTYLSLSTPTFGGVDLHEDWLTKFDNIPELTLVSPTPFSYSPGPEYASALLTGLKAVLTTRLSGGTGLSPAVEQAIWDRARSREESVGQANENEIMRASEALGFQLPPGVLAAQLRAAQQDTVDKISSLSRDIAIKQAELEQENLKQTIDEGIRLEGQLIDYSYKLEALAFESAKAYAENAIQIFNGLLDQHKTLMQAYQIYATVYDTIIKSELSKVEVFKALLQAEETKANVNRALTEQYKAQIEAGMAQVKIFEAQIGAAKTLVELEGIKISAAGEQIKAYVAQVNAETAKVEAGKIATEAEATKATIYKIKADVFAAKTSAQAEKARAEISRLGALAQVKSAEWDGYKAQVGAEGERMRALATQSSALLDGFKAETSAIEVEAGMHTKVWEAQIKNYEAGQNLVLQAGKINSEALIATRNAQLEASKVGAQVYAQLAASSYGMVSAGATISGTGSTSVNYNYSNDTATAPQSMTSA